jgi:diacylglycerol kinase (ATP)
MPHTANAVKSTTPPKPATGAGTSSAASLTPRKALLIVNPHSRRGSDVDLQTVIALLEAAGLVVIRRDPQSPAQCARELEAHCGELDVVIVAGGDGTVNSVAAFLYRHHKPLAILPLGTANDLARSLSIPDDVVAAGQLVLDGHMRRIDLGVVNDHYFFNAVNIGLGAVITHQLTPAAKQTWGVFSYLTALWKTLSRKRSFRLDITVDGRRYRQRSIHLTIGNGRYYGGGNVVDQQAQIDSGKLCLYSLQPQPTWRLLVLAPLVRLGRQRLASRTFSATGRRIEISTSRRLEVHADGELVTRTPATLTIIPGALSVFAPPQHEAVS